MWMLFKNWKHVFEWVYRTESFLEVFKSQEHKCLKFKNTLFRLLEAKTSHTLSFSLKLPPNFSPPEIHVTLIFQTYIIHFSFTRG